ncbi:MAG: protein GumC [Deltaproteobacteria bacterium]|uniref:GumC family protein n=1 Tax=Desulfobacula sp. TaxID=2593537 RepID=UPI0019ABC760|nr:protein GumC [Candidatus Desulfobacula maris]MBL6992812.1 protein GumC [Desulfobacula sp.]
MMDFQQQTTTLKPDQVLEIIIRRRWLILIPVCIALTAGFFYTLKAPKTYMASTTILIQPQKVPTDYVQSIVTADPQQRINTISQQILSRTNLEKIINQFGLFQDKENMYPEDKINSMRERVVVTQTSSRYQSTEAFVVSFTGGNPEIVMQVANKLAGFFMDENLKAREIQAIGTSDFLESELEKIKVKLEDREKEIAAYRAKHMGGLPGELETNLRTLDRLQLQYSDDLNTLRDTQNDVALLKTQISRLREMEQTGREALQADGTLAGMQILSPLEQQYEQEKRQLDEFLVKYTTQHPEVIKLTKSVADLKKKVEKEKQEKDKVTPGSLNTSTLSSNNTVLFQHELTLRQMENEINNLKANIQKIKKTMQVYQKRVEDTPKREQELQSIQRDYNNIKESYNSLLARRLEAELAVNMEKKQKGEQFRILDYARLPEKPISPDVRMLFMLSLAIGFGLGGGAIFLLEFLNPTLRREEQIETEIGLPILASIPPLEQPGTGRKKWIGFIAFAIVCIYAIAIFLLFYFFYLKGINKTLNFIQTIIHF